MPRKDQTLFKNQFRIKSSRLPCWDYSKEAWYFVTICTKDRVCSLSRVVNGKTQFTKFGAIVYKEWNSIPSYFGNVSLDYFVIMPNHIHGIICIDYQAEKGSSNCRDAINRVSTKKDNTTKGKQIIGNNPMLRITLGTIIRHFKAGTTYEIRKLNSSFSWQSRFYEHIIRNEKSLYEIRYYIKYNPAKWERDSYNSKNMLKLA